MASRLYVVDDDALVTRSLGTAMRVETDYEVAAFNDPRAALEAMAAAPPDVVLSDLKMPSLGGLGFLAEVRRRYPSAVLILLTGYADKDSAIRAINEVGVWQYVEKPWDTGDLLVKIRQGLERRELTARLERTNAELASRVRDLETAQERLVSSERLAAVGRVASGLAHELGNQLGLIGFAEAIAARTSDAEVREFAEVIIGARQRLAALVEEIKDFARGSEREYAREPADLAALVEETISILRFDGEVAARRVRTELAAHPIARVHRGKILQVLVNLLRNAAQATSPGDEIVVTVGEADGRARIAIADRGGGMAPEVLARLGEPFFSTKERGSGLGLGISRRIVEEHGGTLEVASQVGEGTTVTVALPLA